MASYSEQRNPNKDLYETVIGEPQGERLPRRPRVCVMGGQHDNMTMDCNEKYVSCEIIIWIGLSKDMI